MNASATLNTGEAYQGALAFGSKVANLRIADSQNLANANYSNPPSCSGRLRSRTLERRNGINGGDPRSGEEAVYAGFAYP